MNKSPRFNRGGPWILKAEGGEVNDPDDPGGHTKFGITKKSYPHLDIGSLTEEQALDIYYEDYWKRCNCDLLPPGVDIAVFDAAAKLLQESVRTSRDGKIGMKTISNANAWHPDELLADYLSRRSLYYVTIILANPSLAKFARGWNKRLFDLLLYIKQ